MDGKRFVTARGWEDLSVVMKVYEQQGLPINYDFVVQYLQDPEIARDFAVYYELYQKYNQIYRIPELLEGEFPEDVLAIQNAPFDEKLSLIGLLLDALSQEFVTYARWENAQKEFLAQLGYLRIDLKEGKGSAKELLERQSESHETMTAHRKKANLLSREELRTAHDLQKAFDACVRLVTEAGSGDARSDFGLVKQYFDEQENLRQTQIADTGRHLSNAFDFLSRVFGEGQELVIFLSELSAGYYSLKFVSECGNEDYYKYNRLLLLKDRGEELTQEVMRILALDD